MKAFEIKIWTCVTKNEINRFFKNEIFQNFHGLTFLTGSTFNLVALFIPAIFCQWF